MWSRRIFKLLLGFLLVTSFLRGQELIYTPKVFFDTTKPFQSLKRYDKATARFLDLIARRLEQRLIEHLLDRKEVILLLKSGIGSDITLFYTFPDAKVYKLSLYSERGNPDVGLHKVYRYGYRIDITLALYIFETAPTPRLLFYRTYRFLRYYPPKGEYLPPYPALAEPVADSFFLAMRKDIDPFIEKLREKLQYYKHLGEENKNGTSKGK